MTENDGPHDHPEDDADRADTDRADTEALRSIDPAATDQPSASLRDRVASIPTVDAAASTAARRTPGWVLPVAAGLALVVGAGGGYVLGAGGASTTSLGAVAGPAVTVAVGTDAEPAPPISLAGAGAAAAPAGAAVSGGGVAADRQKTESSGGASVSPWHYANGRRFAVPAFDSAPGSAPVYALDGRAHYSAADAERIAAALGVTGAAHQAAPENGWTVGDETSSTTATLWLAPSGGGDVSYNGGIADPHTECSNAIMLRYDADKNTGWTEEQWRAIDEETTACVAATPMPTEKQAREAMTRFLAATGVDEAQTQITVTPYEEGKTISVTAARVVGGNVTVVASSVNVSAKGTLNAYGSTAPVVSLGDYRIVSPAEAAARLNDPVFTPSSPSTATGRVDATSFSNPATEPPALPAAGAKVPWGITEFSIASARLGLAQLTSVNDERFLAPAYEFTDTEGNVWSVPALAESELDPVGGGDGRGAWGGAQ